jgi:hypothetical protein
MCLKFSSARGVELHWILQVSSTSIWYNASWPDP